MKFYWIHNYLINFVHRSRGKIIFIYTYRGIHKKGPGDVVSAVFVNSPVPPYHTSITHTFPFIYVCICTYVQQLILKESDQQLILESSWAQLFILSLAQWGVPLSHNQLIRDSLVGEEEQLLLAADLRQLEDIVSRLSQLRYSTVYWRIKKKEKK